VVPQQKPLLIVNISSGLGTAIFDCRIYTTWQMNIYSTPSVKLNLMIFHSGTSTQTPHSASTYSRP